MSPKLLTSWLPVSKVRARRRPVPVLGIEYLEDRTLLTGGLPPDIVVGRTLSAYVVGSVQNNQETITYTVYNEQAAPVTGVLLTDTLAPGVTFTNPSRVPDQSGQKLAWSMGTIQGYDRASVTITLNLPTPIPTQLDSGAQVFGTLDAGTVSNSTPAATLRAGSVDPTLLASTPDANTTDPFIQEEAAKLNYDPQQIFDFLHTQVGYNSYVGSLRGARGTLWSAAGNSLDVASLGVALMRVSGIPAQYESGTLSKSQAQSQILSMFPASYQTVGYIPAATQTADPANDPQLLSETESHYWFQFDSGSGMKDVDPLMAGATVGQSFTTSTGAFSQVADSLRQKTEVKLTAEIYSQASALLGLGDGLSRTVVLDQFFNDVDLVGRPLTIGNFVNQSGAGFIITSQTTTYTPYVRVGDLASDPARDHTITGTQYQEVQTNFPLGNQLLTGLFLDTILTGPGMAVKTYERALVDRIGFAARQGVAGVSVTVAPNGPPALTNTDALTLFAQPGLQSATPRPGVDARLVALVQQLKAIDSLMSSANAQRTEEVAREANVQLTRLQGLDFLIGSDIATTSMSSLAAVRAYFDRPRLVLVRSQTNLPEGGQGPTQTLAIDLRRNDIRIIAAPGQDGRAVITFNVARGLMDTGIESQVLSRIAPPPNSLQAAVDTVQVFDAAARKGIGLTVIGSANLADLDILAISAEAKARILAATQQGAVVVVPTQAVILGGRQTIAWYELNPTTGETIGVTEDGGHQAISEYAAVVSVVSGAILGFILSRILKTNIDNGRFPPETVAAIKDTANKITSPTSGLVGSSALNNLGKKALGFTTFLFGGAFFSAFNLFNLYYGIDPDASLQLFTLPPVPLAPLAEALITASANQSAGPETGTVATPRVATSGRLTGSWSSADISGFLLQALDASSAVVTNGSGVTVGSGTISLAPTAPVAITVEGANQYFVTGIGSLSYYGPAGSTLGVSGEWDKYTANVTGNVSVTLTVPEGALTLNGHPLPSGTYTITTSAATMSGSGNTSSPNFAGSATITATNGTINLEAGSGSMTVGGTALDITHGATLASYSGTITVAAGGGGPDNVTLNGTTVNVLTVSTTPSALTTDHNTPVTFQVHVNTSLADAYTVTAKAPPGWTVSVDASGKVTATPASGLQAGTYPIRIIARSTTNADLIAQTTVPVTVASTLPGIAFAVQPDPQFTVPFNGAQVPSAFHATVRNLGPAADTYTLTITNPPAGFTVVASRPGLAVPAGQTGIDGLYLIPNGSTLPAPGTVVSFKVTATSTTDPTITKTVTVTFTVPEIHGVTLTDAPTTVNTTPGTAGTTSLTVKAVGNVAETVTLSATASAGLSLSSFASSITLSPGQSTTVPVQITPNPTTALNSTLQATFTAAFGPAGTPQTQTLQVPVRVVIPGADAIATAATAAAQLGSTALGARLNDLATALTTLVQHPADPIPKGQALAALDSVVGQVALDPFLVGTVPGLTSARTGLATAGTAADVGAAAVALGNALSTLATTLADEVAHRFTFTLGSNTATALPGSPAVFDLDLQNTGNQATTYDFSISGLPANVAASFSQASVTLAPGESIPQGAKRVTLSLTETGSSLVPAGFTVTATPEGAAELALPASGALTVRPAFVQVTSVTAAPPFTNPGGKVDVTAQVLNAVNAPQTATASYVVKDPGGKVVFTSTPVSVPLTVQASLATADLGSFDTTGLAAGTYTVTVTVTDAGGTPIPGGTGSGSVLVGLPVSATVASTPATLPQGNGTVGTTVSVQALGPTSDLLTLTGQVQTTPTSTTLVLNGTLAYVAGTNGIDVVDVTDPTHPKVLSTFGQALIVKGGFTDIRRVGANTLVVGTTTQKNANGFSVLVYDLSADPKAPALVSNTPFPYAFLTDMEVAGNTVLVTTNGDLISGGSIFNQFGDVIALDLSNPAAPAIARVVENTGRPYSGTTWKNGAVFVTPTTAYVSGTTVTGGDTRTGVGEVLVVDTTIPASTSVLSRVQIPGTVQVLAVGIQGTRALVVGTSAGEQNPFNSTNSGFTGRLTLSVLDVSSPTSPTLLGTTLVTADTFPRGDATNTNKLSILPLGNGEFVVSDSLQAGHPVLLVVDASDPTHLVANPLPVGALVNEMAVSGNLLYTTSSAGLLVYTVHTFPPPLTLAGQVATGQPNNAVALYGTRAYVVGTQNVSVVDVSNPAAPVVQGAFAVNQFAQGGLRLNFDVVSGHYLFVGTHVAVNGGNFTLLVYDLSTDPVNPTLVGQTSIGYPYIYGMTVQGNTVLLAVSAITFYTFGHQIIDQSGDFVTIDVSDPTKPHLAGVLFNTRGTPLGGDHNVNAVAAVTPTVAYAASTTSAGSNVNTGVGRVLVVNTSAPARPTVLTTLDVPGTRQLAGLAVHGNRAVVVGTTGGWLNPFPTQQALTGNVTITVLDTTDPAHPIILGTLVTENTPQREVITQNPDVRDLGNGLFAISNTVLNGKPVIMLVDPTDPASIVVGSVPVTAPVIGLNVAGGELYATDQNGLSVYDVHTVVGVPVTVSVQVPNGTGVSVVPGSFNEAPTQTIPGPAFDTLVWKRSLGYGTTGLTFTWQSAVTGLQPSTSLPVTLGTSVTFTSQGAPGTIALPGTTVTAVSVIGLSPAAQTVAPGAVASYTVTLSNPTSSAVRYTLSVAGVPAGWVGLPASVAVGANGSATVTLRLSPPGFAALQGYGFAVAAAGDNGAVGSVQGTLTVAGPAPIPDPQSHGVVLALSPAAATAGPGTSAAYTVQVTNTGSAAETFALAALGLPAGVAAAFSQNGTPVTAIAVPPGASNFRDVTLTLTPAAGAAPGSDPFSVTATSTSSSAKASAPGTLTVAPTGVSVALDKSTGAPGDTFTATVTNTGTVTDTFDLGVGGPAGLVATLGADKVTLAPGASRTVAVTTGAAAFAVRGSLGLLVMAQSEASPAVGAAASAALAIGGTVGLAAGLTPDTKVIPVPGTSDFIVRVNNTGNTEDAYTATITGTTGPVTASLAGLDGNPTQTIPIFRLPGLSSGEFLLHTTLTTTGQATVGVMVQSQSAPARTAAVTATVMTPTPPTTRVTLSSDNPTPAFGQPVTFTAVVPPLPGLGTPTGTITFASGPTTLGAAPLVNGTATLVTTALPAGATAVTATYSGDASYTTAVSPPLPEAVRTVRGGKGQVYAVGAGPGGGPRVEVFDAATNAPRFNFFAFDSSLRGGVSVATGDVNGDGVEDVIVGAGVGGGANVKVFDGQTGALIASWFAYDPAFRGGVWVAAEDLYGDGRSEVITGPGVGGGPVVEVWRLDGATPTRVTSFAAYEPGFRGGVTVAAGLTPDGRPDIVVGAGPGGGPRVRTFDAATLALLSDVFVYEPSFTGGVYVSAGDVLGIGAGTQVLVGPGPGGGPRLEVLGADGLIRANVFAAVSNLRNGLTIAAVDKAGSAASVLVGAGRGAFQGTVSGNSLAGMKRVGFFEDGFDGGVFVG